MPRNASPLLVGDAALYRQRQWASDLPRCEDRGPALEREPRPAALGLAGVCRRDVYLLAEDGTATVFKPGSSYDPVAINKMGERALASYAVDGNALYLRTAKVLYRIEKK